jgi:hypothetical protein
MIEPPLPMPRYRLQNLNCPDICCPLLLQYFSYYSDSVTGMNLLSGSIWKGAKLRIG